MTTNRSLNSRYTPAQQDFLASIVDKCHNDLTPADHEAAARVGMSFASMTYPKTQPLPANPTYQDVCKSW